MVTHSIEQKETIEKVIYDNGVQRLVAETDGSLIQLSQTEKGQQPVTLVLDETDMATLISLLETTKKRKNAQAMHKAGQERTSAEQDAAILELSKGYVGEDKTEWLDGVLWVKPIRGRDADGTFNYHYHAFVAEQDKIVVLTFRVLGGDRFGDRVFTNREYYRYGESDSYYSKRGGIKASGKYGKALKRLLELVKTEKEPDFEARKIA